MEEIKVDVESIQKEAKEVVRRYKERLKVEDSGTTVHYFVKEVSEKTKSKEQE